MHIVAALFLNKRGIAHHNNPNWTTHCTLSILKSGCYTGLWYTIIALTSEASYEEKQHNVLIYRYASNKYNNLLYSITSFRYTCDVLKICPCNLSHMWFRYLGLCRELRYPFIQIHINIALYENWFRPHCLVTK